MFVMSNLDSVPYIIQKSSFQSSHFQATSRLRLEGILVRFEASWSRLRALLRRLAALLDLLGLPSEPARDTPW